MKTYIHPFFVAPTKNSTLLRICWVLMFLGTTGITLAQTTGSKSITLNLQEIALLDIEPDISTLNFNFTAPSEAGSPLTAPATNTTRWLNYTSAVELGDTRIITAQIDGTIPGVSIKLQAAAAQGGGGTLGITAGQVTLSTASAVNIITGIGGAYTGNGINNGHRLTISLEINDYTELVQTNNEVITITYTITN